jgi:hypothetical protein
MMTMPQALITSRDPKGLHAVGLFEAAFNKAKLDEYRAQRLNENGGEFQMGLQELIAKFSLSNQYASEEVRSNYTYPSEYKGPKSIREQVVILAEAFSLSADATLEYLNEMGETMPLPEGAEGLFAIPRWELVAGSYGTALEKLLGILASKRTFYNYREDELGPEKLRQHVRTSMMLETICQQQTGDILVIPSQFGMRHRGRSTRRAREVFNANEFGHGGFAVGCMALTHQERFVRWEQLHADCPGDEFSPDADGRFSGAPCFHFGDGRLGFGSRVVGYAVDFCGSVSGFLPQ